jgi:hypothetical protein
MHVVGCSSLRILCGFGVRVMGVCVVLTGGVYGCLSLVGAVGVGRIWLAFVSFL